MMRWSLMIKHSQKLLTNTTLINIVERSRGLKPEKRNLIIRLIPAEIFYIVL